MKQLFDISNLNLKQGILPELYSQDDIVESAFNEFRERGFPYPDMTIAEMKIELNRLRKLPISQCKNTTMGYKIADMFNKHRFASTILNGKDPVSSFFDDTKLKKALKMSFESGTNMDYSYKGFMGLVNGTQACSNFRPAFAKYIYIKYCPENGKVFDPSFGYGGRLVGFLSSYCSEYVGTDPSILSFKGNRKLIHTLNIDKKIKLFNLPI